MRQLLIVSAVVGLLVHASPVAGQTLGGRLYSSDEHGFIGKMLAEDSRGFLWVGGYRLHRLDGYRYLPLGRWAGLPEEPITALAVDAQDAVWVGMASGLYRLTGPRFEKLRSAAVRELYAASGGIYAVSDRFEFWHIAGGKWRAEPISTPIPPGKLHKLGNSITYPCDSALCTVAWTGSGFQANREETSAPRGPWVEAMRAFGMLYLSGSGSHLYLERKGGQGQWAPVAKHPASTGTQPLLTETKDRSGELKAWVTLKGYIADATRGSFLMPERPDEGSFLPLAHDPMAFTRLEERIGGIVLVDPVAPVWHWDAHFELTASPTMVAGVNGRILATTENGIYQFMNEGETTHCSLPAVRAPTVFCKLTGSNDDYYYDLTTDSAGQMWAIDKQLGVVRLREDGSIAEIVRVPVGVVTADVRRIVRTEDGRIFVASKECMMELRRDGSGARLEPVRGLETPAKRDYEAIHYTAEFTRARDGGWWALVDGGIARYRDGRWEYQTLPCLLTTRVMTAAVENENSIWIAYRANLPYTHVSRRLAGQNWTCRHFGDAAPIPGSTDFLRFDRRGRLWRGGGESIYMTDVALGREPAFPDEWTEIGKDGGLGSAGPRAGGLFEDSAGTMWITLEHSISTIPASFVWKWEKKVEVAALEFDGGSDWLDSTGWHTNWQNEKVRRLYLASLPLSASAAPSNVEWRGLDAHGNPINLWRPAIRGVVELDGLERPAHTIALRARGKTIGEFQLAPTIPWYSNITLWAITGAVLATGCLVRTRRIREWIVLRREHAAYWRGKQQFHRLRQPAAEEAGRLKGLIIGGRFAIDHFLAEGGFASVYLGRDLERGGEWVAIKLIRFRPDLLDWINRRWRLEQQALETLRHPGILQPRAAGVEGEQLYIATEYIEGLTVREVLREGRMEKGRAWARIGEICDALAYAHHQGILHCDLKPDNIMLRDAGRDTECAVVIDFGTAVLCAPDRSVMDSGRLAGVLDYIAPERIGGKLSTATDVYSLAVTVFEMLTGVRWRDAEATKISETLLSDVLGDACAGAPPTALATAFRSAIAFDAHQRMRSVNEFREAIGVGLGYL